MSDERVVIYANSNVSRGKYAAAAVHAALTAAGVHPGLPVIVLGARPDEIENLTTVIHDAGKTEVAPGTVTAGTDWPFGLRMPTGAAREALATILATWRDGEPQQWAIEMYEEAADAILAAGWRPPREPITDEMVEAAARASFEVDSIEGDDTWAQMVTEDASRAEIWRADARKILEAAEAKR